MKADSVPTPHDDEVAALRTRVAVLEAEIADQARRTAATVATAQEKLYWLERWQIDLDAVMRRPGAIPALEALKRLREITRSVRRFKRRVLGS